MPTVIGLFWGVASIFCLAKRGSWLFGLTIFAALFQGSSSFNFNSQGVQPFYPVACLFVVSQIYKQRYWNNLTKLRGKWLLIVFGGVGVFSAFIYPFVFAGVSVYTPKIGLDNGYFFRSPLEFGLSNVTQAAYLVIDIFVVFAAAAVPRTSKVVSFYDFAFYFLAGVVFIQFLCDQVGIAFPYSLVWNNPSYATYSAAGLSGRVTGTFSEPSMAGITLILFYAGYFYEFFAGTRSPFRAVVAAIAIGFVRSSSSLIAIIIVTILIIFCRKDFRFPWVTSLSRLAKFIAALLVSGIIISSPISSVWKEYTMRKNETTSYIYRMAADVFSFHLAADTHWVGVGIGSNRPSSLVVSLLSTVGIFGTTIFLLMVIEVGRNAKGANTWARWSLFAALLDMCLSVPDITMPILWIILALAAYHAHDDICESN